MVMVFFTQIEENNVKLLLIHSEMLLSHKGVQAHVGLVDEEDEVEHQVFQLFHLKQVFILFHKVDSLSLILLPAT